MVKHDDPDMHGQRSRNKTDGRLRKKRGDAHASTTEREYGVDICVHGDTHLDTFRKRTGKSSVEDVIEDLTEEAPHLMAYW